ncbi:MAG: hypothetical protein IBX62_02290 [Coriobacteriia bacterium]|nr:hypothetical protein [Coriobacteriia bacterium]
MQLLARTCSYDRMNVERVLARLFILGGGAFWVVATFGATWAYEGGGIVEAVGTALLPLAVTVGAFLVGWFYERLAALLLALGAAVVVGWGLVAGWETGVWITVLAVLIGPMLVAALLFMLASRMQVICGLQEGAPVR